MRNGVVNDIPGVDAETYERVLAAARVEAEPPNGLIIHASGAIETGWRVLSVWRSREAFERFRAELERSPDHPAVMGGNFHIEAGPAFQNSARH